MVSFQKGFSWAMEKVWKTVSSSKLAKLSATSGWQLINSVATYNQLSEYFLVLSYCYLL